MWQKVKNFIQQNHLLPPKAKIIVGLSGGADSIALLHLLHQAEYSCIAAHCNFQLRGEESLRDERFCTFFAHSLEILFEKITFDTRTYSLNHRISIEMAARELRYTWFEELRLKYNADAIAVAHHKDDSIETVLLNLIRGTGIHGLTGIHPKSKHIIRPLLCIDKKEILHYAKENNLNYVTDSTNLESEYIRNKIRLQIIPMLQEINPSVSNAIERTANNLFHTVKIYDDSIKKGINNVVSHNDTGEITICIKQLLSYPSPETLLYEILSTYHFNSITIGEIMNSLTKQSGKLFYSSTHQLVKDRKSLILKEKNQIKLPQLETKILPYSDNFELQPDKNIAYFDFDKLKFPLTIRQWKEGDYFIPLGMTGKQKISKYFKDHLINRIQKDNTMLLCNEEDIIWIIGERIDNRYCITKNTKFVYQVSILSLKKIQD